MLRLGLGWSFLWFLHCLPQRAGLSCSRLLSAGLGWGFLVFQIGLYFLAVGWSWLVSAGLSFCFGVIFMLWAGLSRSRLVAAALSVRVRMLFVLRAGLGWSQLVFLDVFVSFSCCGLVSAGLGWSQLVSAILSYCCCVIFLHGLVSAGFSTHFFLFLYGFAAARWSRLVHLLLWHDFHAAAWSQLVSVGGQGSKMNDF